MNRRTALAISLVVLVLDQVTKAVVLATIEERTPIEVTSFFNLVLVWNTGISFGMLAGLGDHSSWVLVGLSVVIGVVVAVWFAREERGIARLALALVLSGAIGNVIDRVRFGAVVDFLDFHLASYHWPAFNVADSAIVVGAALLILDGLLPRAFGEVEERR